MAKRSRKPALRRTRRGTVSKAAVVGANEAALWLPREPTARAAVIFWDRFLVLRMGRQHDLPLDSAAIDRLVTIVRAVSWVESRHGTATTNQGRRDPMQCGHPRDAWWKELTSPGGPTQDRFITGPGGANHYAGDLPGAVETTTGFPPHARISTLTDKSLGHEDPAFNETLSYVWAVPILVHKTNAAAGGQTFKCGDLSRDRLISGAVAYNGGGDPKYRDKIIEALALSGGLPMPAKALALMEEPPRAAPLRRVIETLNASLNDVAARRGIARVRGASLKVNAALFGDGAWLVGAGPAGSPECSITLNFSPARRSSKQTANSTGTADFVESLWRLLAEFPTGPFSVGAEIEVPIDLEWTGDSVVIRSASADTAPHILKLNIGR
jgi:hypothetical protein